jgi:demethylmenaquinone methyltransferase/2-methoxy-6-polyprenyl-1,4-benzoquinol methylase
MEEMKGTWDRIWQDQPDTVSNRDILYMVDEIKLEYTLQLLPAAQGKMTTIEIGSGSGRLSCFLASAGYKTICLDYSPNALRVAYNNYKLAKNEGTFILADARFLPFRSNSLDVVLSTGLIEHFPDAQPVVDEMARILKPGGFLISDVVPKKWLVPFKFSLYCSSMVNSVISWVITLGKHTPAPPIYEKKLGKRDIRHLLESAGLERVTVFAAGVVPPPLYLPHITPLKERAYTMYNRAVYRLKPFVKGLDGTIIAEWFGLYYYVHARKPDR